ncbi:MAG: M16 family metallopeptidase [Candidatus Tectimicrobiota bacterium]
MNAPPSRPILDTRLPSGLRLVVEPLDHVRSVAVGVWVTTGSRHEPDELLGVSHFLEHVVFKGTARRSAKAIARAIDAVGGQLDAFTGREMACYYAKVLDELLPEALDLLSDILADPVLNPEDIERERRVILEEIKLAEDTPAEDVFDLFYAAIFDGHPLGRPVIGTPGTVGRLQRDELVAWRASHIFAENLLIAISGSCRPEEVADAVGHAFSFPAENHRSAPAPGTSSGRRLMVKEKGSEQVHLCLGFPSVNDASPRRYVASVLSAIVGGGVASRLFQRVREEEGLAYAVHSFLDLFSDAGAMGIYAGVSPDEVVKVLAVIGQELQSVAHHGVQPDELTLAKVQFKGQMTLALEDTSNRMSRLAKQMITFGRHWTLEESLAMVDAVSLDDVQALARELFVPSNYCLAVIGPIAQEVLEARWPLE